MADILILLHTESENGLNMTVVLSHSHSALSTLPQVGSYHLPNETHGYTQHLKSKSIRYQGFTMCSEIIKFHDLLAPETGCLRESIFFIHKQ